MSIGFYKLFEGGNVFKGADKQPVTTRIAKENIEPSLSFVEEILGFKLDNWLGTTGKKESSGDIDVSVDSSKHDKKEVANKLKSWAKENGYPPGEWVKLSGDNVHFKTPIRNTRGEVIHKNLKPEFAQLDLMFGNPRFQAWSMRGEPGNNFKGVHRHIILASIAKAQGKKWSYKNGLVNRATNEIISQDPKEIVRTLLPGYSGNPDELSVESILDYVYKKYNGQPQKIEALVGEAAETLAEHYGVQLPMPNQQEVHESNSTDEYFLAKLRNRIVDLDMMSLIESEPLYKEYVVEGKLRDMNHIEDLILDEGPSGLYKAIKILRAFAEGKAQTETTIKWDGCISGDSILVTEDGERTIADIIEHWETEEIKVLAHDFETSSDEYVQINMAGKQHGSKDWVEITLENGKTIKLTENHEVYTTNRGWVAAAELTENDDIKESTIK